MEYRIYKMQGYKIHTQRNGFKFLAQSKLIEHFPFKICFFLCLKYDFYFFNTFLLILKMENCRRNPIQFNLTKNQNIFLHVVIEMGCGNSLNSRIDILTGAAVAEYRIQDLKRDKKYSYCSATFSLLLTQFKGFKLRSANKKFPTSKKKIYDFVFYLITWQQHKYNICDFRLLRIK